jgi:PAS domain S-box-containing protein
MDPSAPASKIRKAQISNTIVRVVVCIAAVLVVVAALSVIHVQPDRMLSAALNLFLIVVLIASILWGTRYAILLALLSALGFSWSLPPSGHFHLSDLRVWTLLTACLVAGIVAGQLGNRARKEAVRAKQAEGAARRNEKELRDAIDTIPTMAWSTLPDGANDFANQSWLEYTGISAKDASVAGWRVSFHPADIAIHVEKWRVSLATGKPFENEARIQRAKDREYRWFLHRGVPLRDENGNILKWYGIATDIDDRKRAEQALSRSEAYLAEAQKLSHTGSWAYKPGTNKAFYWSEEMFRIWGFDPTQGPPDNETAWQRIHPEDRKKMQQHIEEARESSLRSEVAEDHRIVLPDGTVKHIHGTSHPVFDEAGQVVEYVGTAVDVTERKRAEEERERLRELQADLARINRVTTMGELTASLAHEVNQPIAAAVTNANTSVRWLAGEAPNIDEAREAVKRAAKDATRAAEIINRIRALFKKGEAQREWIAVNDILDDMIVLLRNEARQYSVSICSKLSADLPHVMADRVQLQQVLMNLMANSIDAMKGVDGTRELTLVSQRAGSGQVLVSVSDKGVGLPTDVGQIFNAFFTTKPHGTGLGLAISRSIIESHGGRLWASSNSGPGATFYFTLPTRTEA